MPYVAAIQVVRMDGGLSKAGPHFTMLYTGLYWTIKLYVRVTDVYT